MKNPGVSLEAWKDIYNGMILPNERHSKAPREMIVGDFVGTDIYNLDSIHFGTFAELEDLGEKLISSNTKTPSYRISTHLDNRLNFINKESLTKFENMNSKQFIIKEVN